MGSISIFSGFFARVFGVPGRRRRANLPSPSGECQYRECRMSSSVSMSMSSNMMSPFLERYCKDRYGLARIGMVAVGEAMSRYGCGIPIKNPVEDDRMVQV